MPSYEYNCQACDRVFVMTMSVTEHNTTQVQCPQCKGTEVKALMSAFVAVTSKKS